MYIPTAFFTWGHWDPSALGLHYAHTLTDSSQLGIYGQFIKSPRPPWLSQLPYLPVKYHTIPAVHCLPCIELQSFANGAADLSSFANKVTNLINNFSY